MGITVQKFGGTSVDRMAMVKGIIETEVKRGNITVPVVSAFSGETDKLIKIAETIQKDPSALIQQNFIELFQDIVVGTLRRAQDYLNEQGIGIEQKDQVLSEIEDFLWRKVLSVHVEIDQFLTFSSQGSEISHPFPEDRIIGLGEVFSAHVLARTFSVRNDIDRVFLDVDTANIWTFGDVPNIFIPGSHGVIDERQLHTVLSGEIANRVTHVNAQGAVPVVPGYAGHVPGGIKKVFGRGYSDAEVALAAKGLKRTIGRDKNVEVQIWKEGDGLRSADPRLVQNTKLYSHVHKDEAAELSAAGMKAINPNANRVLDGEDVDVSVKNTLNPASPGTLITAQEDLENPGVRFFTGKKGQTTFSVSSALMVDQDGVAADILDVCKKAGISIDAITTSECVLVFSMDQKDAGNEHLLTSLQKYGTVERQDNMALVCCIGNSMADKKGLLAWLSGILAAEGINIAFDGGDGKRNITFIIDDKDYERAVKILHEVYFYPNEENVRKVVRSLIESFAPDQVGLIR